MVQIEASKAVGTDFLYNGGMWRWLGLVLALGLVFLSSAASLYSQTANLSAVRVEGLKAFPEAQAVSLTGLKTGTQVGRGDLQDAADLLLRSGLFSKVNYKFDTHNDSVVVTFHLEESPRLRVAYDNFPWFSDSELADAIRAALPFYDGTLPEGGTVVELAGNALAAFLDAHHLKAQVEHFVLDNPLIDAKEQQFQVSGITETIASVEFSDPALNNSHAVQQHMNEIRGKPYSRLAVDVFLAESIRPIYLAQGNLRAKVGPAEVRLSGDPNQKLPEAFPVYVACEPGPVYHWSEAQWKGNSAIPTETLQRDLGLAPGELADGMKLEGGWERVREAYAHLGFLDAKVTPVPKYDEAASRVSYAVEVSEGKQYRYKDMTITGMSVAGEGLIRDAWPLKPGDVMDKAAFEDLLARLESKRQSVFKELPVHYENVGHWLQTNADGTVEVLLDFK